MRVCFIALYVYPLFRPTVQGIFGGSEVRTWLLATALSRFPEHEVICIVFKHGQPAPERVGQIMLVPHSFYRAPQTLPSAPELPPNTSWWYRLWSRLGQKTVPWLPGTITIEGYTITRDMTRVYDDVAADVYCVCGVSNFAAEVAAYCQRAHRKFILLAASDVDFALAYCQGSKHVNPFGSRADLCHYVIMTADRILTQTDEQAALVRTRFGRDSITLRNPIDLLSTLAPASSAQVKAALWIGKSDRVKQPDMLLRLAVALPYMRFVMVMNRVDPDLFDDIAANKPPNVDLIEQVPFSEVERLFSQAFVLVNTSRFEGFPNTFLQAGKYRVPVLSWQVDPDGFISRYGCGIVANGDRARLTHGLAHMYADMHFRERCGNNMRLYVETHHRLEDKIDEFNQVLSTMSIRD
jgi:hypothetical protein